MYHKLQKKVQSYNQFKANLKLISKFKFYFLDTIETLLIALVLALLIKTFICQVSVVPTGSMIPTLIGGVQGKQNDRLFVNKFIYDFSTPKRGDIVVFKSPLNDGKDYVKRCVGLPGDILEVKRGVIYINNKELILAGVDIQNDYDFYGPITIDENAFFMMGDNRAMSQDSRFFGVIPKDHVIGQAFFTFWPFSRMRWLN